MFTGIVEETGRLISLEKGSAAWKFRIQAGVVLGGVALGDSISVNGCCMTVVAFDDRHLEFDVLEETRRLTNFGQLAPGAAVNLERSLSFGGKIGGHFVTGHIDGQGSILVSERRGSDHYLRVAVPPGQGRYLIRKGSIAIDGVSLTVAETSGDEFAVWLIPHTLQATRFRDNRAGDGVNLEYDLLGKYVEKLLNRG